MSRSKSLTGVEREFHKEVHLITTTDTRGVITYANDEFIEVSGYERHELIGKNHNVIRHPAMPSYAFKDLWDTLKQGKSWRGAVLNRCKNGDHYWVDAYVTPIVKDGKVVEYQSIRTILQPDQKKRATELYKRWVANALPRKLQKRVLRYQLFYTSFFIASLSSFALWLYLTSGNTEAAIATVLLLAYCFGSFRQLRRMKKLNSAAAKTTDSPIMSYIYTGSDDAYSQVAFALSTQRQEVRALMARLVTTAELLMQSRSDTSLHIGESARQSMNQHKSVTDLVNELSVLVSSQQQVINIVANSMELTEKTNNSALHGEMQLSKMLSLTQDLDTKMQSLTAAFSKLTSQSDKIVNVVNVIRDVAGKTNMLALNAAIEAARAGEYGRGFAVVADEIRALAATTEASTHEIELIISDLHGSVKDSSTMLELGCESLQATLQSVSDTSFAINDIKESVMTIKDQMLEVTACCSSQLKSCDNLHAEVQSVEQLAQRASQSADKAQNYGDSLALQLENLNALASHFLAEQQKESATC